jgi:hypothetical protein
MDAPVTINKLKKISLFLFLIPVIGLFFSLIFQNILTITKFSSDIIVLDNINPTFKIECNEATNNCLTNKKVIDVGKQTFASTNKLSFELSNCNIFYIKKLIVVDEKNADKKMFKKLYQSDIKNEFCIKNSNIYKYHKIFPVVINSLGALKRSPNYRPGVSEVINPFIYGETSISNIVKRFPINYLFKPLMFLTSFVMVLYWLKCGKILNILSTQNNNYWFMYFGIASSFCFFFHVYFLGTEITNENFTNIRKIILLLFIIFELFAQIIFTRKLYLMQDILNDFISELILKLKIVYTLIIGITSCGIISMLIFYGGFTSKVDYIIEWNYFTILLIFYLLSFLIWKKKN